jgi:protein arginine kinase
LSNNFLILNLQFFNLQFSINMICEICSENQVSFIISIVLDSELKELRVCDECAINGMKYENHHINDKTEDIGLICSHCNSKYQYDSTDYCAPLLGCPWCYTQFHEAMVPLLRRIHGCIKHKGKSAFAPNTPNLVPQSNGRTAELSNGRTGRLPFSRSSVSTREAEWMQGKGPSFDVVVSSRIRLARNIDGYSFSNLADQNELYEVAGKIEKALADLAESDHSPLHNGYVVDLEDIDSVDRDFLMERHLISRDLAENRFARRVIIDEKEIISIMINEEDHVRLQGIDSGLQIRELWGMINSIDDQLGNKVDYVYSPDWGFLTACPTNVGTGLRVSVMFHIPALSATKEGKRILTSITNMGYAIRGIYGEGSRATGAFYQISNEATLGQSEEEIIDRMQSVAFQILAREREERQSLLERDRTKLEDIVFRAYGTLANARSISSTESMQLLSWVSLGVSLDIFSGLDVADIARLLVLTRPAHLQKLEKKELNVPTQNINRAKVIRTVLKNV